MILPRASTHLNPALITTCERHRYNNNNNNNNNYDDVYGAIIVTKVIGRVHPFHLTNVDWAPGGRQPSDQASRLGL